MTRTSMTESALHAVRFLAYVLRRFSLARLTVVVSLAALSLEYALLSVMIPLAGATAAGTSGRVEAIWTAVAGRLGFPPTQATWLWFFLFLTCASVVLGYVNFLLSTWLSKQVHSSMSERIFRRVLFDEPMIDIYRRSIGHYITLAGDDTYRAGTIVNTAALAFAGGCSAVAGFVLLYLFSPSIFLCSIAFLAISGALIGLGFSSLLRDNARTVEMSRELGTAYIEGLNGLRSIRSMSSEAYVHDSYSAGLRRYVRLLFRVDATRQSMRVVPSVLLLVLATVILWPSTARSAQLTVGYFLALTTILIRIFLALGQIVQYGATLLLDVRAAKDIEELVGEGAPVPRAAELGEPIVSIELQDVHFAYPDGKQVMSGFSFRFDAGRTYAVVGRSGAGKSTLADLLLGLVEPQGGRVLVNGRAGEHRSLRRHVVLVEQQARIFTASVRENLLLGLTATDDELWDALRTVDLEAFVRALPLGLDSVFQYQGANLSGGQRQRIGIARAVLRRPDAMILDEATSALDTETRRTIVANLRVRMRDGTLIFITHEQAIAEEADVVLPM